MSKPKTEKTAKKSATKPKKKSGKKSEMKPEKKSDKKTDKKAAKKPDWEKIKTEYITGNISYQKLAKKHRVSFNTLKGRARREKWGSERKKSRDKISKKAQRIIENKTAEQNAEEAINLVNVSQKLLKKISDLCEDEESDEKKIKALTGALKDIKEIQGGNTDNEIKIIIENDDIKKWSE